MSADLSIQLPAANNGTTENVSFQVTDQPYDQVPNVRLFCTMHHTAYTLQIRGLVPLSKKGGIKKPQPLIASASLSWDDLCQIAAYVQAIKKEIIEGHYDELRTENPDK
jgi:hypothetical protein